MSTQEEGRSKAQSHQQAKRSSRLGLEVPGETNKLKSPLPAPQSKARQSPCQKAGARSSSSSRDLHPNKTLATAEAVPVINEPNSMSSKARPPPEPTKGTQPITETAGGGKKRVKTTRKGMSLSKILAATNPKTKRGLRIGLPREEKHRLCFESDSSHDAEINPSKINKSRNRRVEKDLDYEDAKTNNLDLDEDYS
ncbi:hypothetical protein Pst134EA_017132 [Puccinia striiformis f. sp. tritici]|uniref:hypothetical protein n=1 Tax=Puccinia striiformis f. sp. tritici TaxID=168172 RepID=UPI0020087F54|nr:hypothetical protein Pst134EA_017132 [Puccinia striiformis f. sp. tritici]KAH9450502.1 hypothetical protein Pst134EB_018038 [Puccinia striiformis f. sp. tritici]KAH9460816.1 hypothetical protein Pst134EA_017132 [Puccinia striiformis f. sp. tritici]